MSTQTSTLAARTPPAAAELEVAVPAALGGGSGRVMWTRRSFLTALSAVSLGAVAGCGFSPVVSEDVSGGGGGRAGSGATGGRAGGAAGAEPSAPVAPFTLSPVNVELSEDYFPVVNHPIDPTVDTVIAYSRTDGEVEAMVLQDGVVKQIYRDDTQAGGWNVYALPDADHVTSMVAAISGPVSGVSNSAAVLKVFYTTTNSPNTLIIATENPLGATGPSFGTETKPWAGLGSPLQLARNFDGSLLVTAQGFASYLGSSHWSLFFYGDGTYPAGQTGPAGPAWGYLPGLPQTASGPFPYATDEPYWAAAVVEPFVGGAVGPHLTLALANSVGSTDPVIQFWNFPMVAGQTVAKSLLPGPVNNVAPPPPPGGHNSCSVAAMATVGIGLNPTLIVRTFDDHMSTAALWVLSPDDQAKTWAWTPLTMPADLGKSDSPSVQTALVPVPAANHESEVNNFLDIFLIAEQTLNVIRQAPTSNDADATTPVYYPPIPLQPDVRLMTGQIGSSLGNELLVVGSDGNLQALTADPLTGIWRSTVLQLPASELQQVSAYRLELTLIDYWGRAVPNQALTVTASSPALGLVDGQTVNLSATAVTLTTDARGGAELAVLADGLSTPTLTFSAANLATAAINPATNINTYLQGGTPLNYQDPLTPTTLQRAQTSDGQTVAPGLELGDARTAVTNMSTAAGWAAPPSLTAARVSTITAHRHGRRRSRPRGRDHVGHGVGDTDFTIQDWVHDAWHGIKTAAFTVANVAVTAGEQAFLITGDLAHWTGQGLTIFVHGVEDAINVVHAVLNQIGAALYRAVKWLEAEVIGVLQDAGALAGQYDQWLEQLIPFLGTQFGRDAAAVDAWLVAKQAAVKASFSHVATTYPASATLSDFGSGSLTATRSTTRKAVGPARPQPPRRGLGDDTSGQAGPHKNWLFSKIKRALLGEVNCPDVTGLADLINNLDTAIESGLADLTSAYQQFWQFLETAITDPKKVGSLGVQHLMAAVGDLVDAVFTLLRGAVSALMTWFGQLAAAIPAMLGTPLSALPLVGELLKLAGLGDVKLSNVLTWVAAFPAVVAYRIANKGQGRPFGGATSGTEARGPHHLGDAAGDMKFCSTAALGLWALTDTASDLISAGDESVGPLFFEVADMLYPLLVTGLTYPTAPAVTGPTYTAPATVDPEDAYSMNFIAWLAGAVPALSVATNIYVEQKLADNPLSTGWKSDLQYVTCVSGVVSLVFGCIGNSLAQSPNPADYASAVLNSMSNIIAPLLIDDYVKESEGLTALVAGALTLFCGAGGAAANAYS